VLADTYQKIIEQHKEGDVEFVLVTGDVNEHDFDSNRRNIPFPAVPFKEAKVWTICICHYLLKHR
jgi:hypothetical protein